MQLRKKTFAGPAAPRSNWRFACRSWFITNCRHLEVGRMVSAQQIIANAAREEAARSPPGKRLHDHGKRYVVSYCNMNV